MRPDSLARALNLCTISDSTEAVLLLSDCLALLPEHSRTDLQAAEALDYLGLRETGDTDRFDLVLVAIPPGRDELLAGTQAIVTLASSVCRMLVLLSDDASADSLELPINGVRLGPEQFSQLPELIDRTLSPAAGDKGDAPTDAEPARTAKHRNRLAALLQRLPGRRIRQAGQAPFNGAPAAGLAAALARPNAVVAFQGLSGGVGTTTLAVNLAQCLAARLPQDTVCLIDLNLQFGVAGSYLGLPENSRIMDAYRNPGALDEVSFEHCLTACGRNFLIFSAPELILPWDALSREDVANMIGLARKVASKVVIDLPHAVLDWTRSVYDASDATVLVATRQISSVRNARPLRALMHDNGISTRNIIYALNRVPTAPSDAWAVELASIEAGLDAQVAHFFPEGGAEVAQACDIGVPLAKAAADTPLASELQRLVRRVKSLQSNHQVASVV